MSQESTSVVQGFSDELQKLAAMKVRSGRRPIRAQLLAEAGHVSKVGQVLPMQAAVATGERLAPALGRALAKKWRTLAVMGGGGALALGGRQAKEDLQQGRQMRLALARQQAQYGA